MNLDLENLVAEGRRLLSDAVKEACSSADPVVAELAREIAAGRLTPREALAGSAYGELLETKLEGALRHLEGSDDQPQPVSRSTVDDEDFSQRNYLHRSV